LPRYIEKAVVGRLEIFNLFGQGTVLVDVATGFFATQLSLERNAKDGR
jgi:hypothetical protein